MPVDCGFIEKYMNKCAELGGKVSMAFVTQGLKCGHFIPSMIVSESLASIASIGGLCLLFNRLFQSICVCITKTTPLFVD